MGCVTPAPTATLAPMATLAPPPTAVPTVDIEATDEDLWENEFPAVMRRINAAMVTPASALLEVYGCETQEDCDTSLRRLPRALGPATEELRKEITILEALDPSARYQVLHSSYLQTLKLRLESFELYIAGAEDNDNTLLEAGADAWTRAQKKQSENMGLILDFLREEGGLSSEAAWMMELGAVQQAFLQNEGAIAPALEAFFSCQTQKECDNALKTIPSALRPGQAKLAQLLVTLEKLESPATFISCSMYQSALHKSYRLRFEAYDLFIRAVEESDDNLLDEGVRAWNLSMEAAADGVAFVPKCTQSFR